MASLLPSRSINLVSVITFCLIFTATAQAFSSESREEAAKFAETLVRVNIISEIQGIEGGIEINGKLVEGYSPIIIRDFTSTGIVIDGGKSVLTFLGYRWVDIQSDNPRIEITTSTGKKWKGSLVGIDQSNGAAVIRLAAGTLRKTPTCLDCELTDGAVIIAPVIRETGTFQFRKAEVLAAGAGSMQTGATVDGPVFAGRESWNITISQPFFDVGQPVFSSDYRVLGFIAGWDP
ncbi:MAG TPA: hypothetical protein VLL97_14185, partial [Acidobacteriota bacterium]|nr:hypothetical protein [Acidobacteriota bacterium]